MKKIFFYLLLLFCTSGINGQSLPDSIMAQYNRAQTNSAKGKVLINYVRRSMQGNTTEKISVLLKQHTYFTERKEETGIHYTDLCIGIVSWRSGEFTIALKYIVPSLQYFEEQEDSLGILRSLDALGSTFANSQNYEQALGYFKKALPIAKQYNDPELYASILNNTADCFIRMNLPDSALLHIQEAVRISLLAKDTSMLSYAIGTMGETYMLLKDYEIARPFLKQSVFYSFLKNDRFGHSYSLNSVSQSFFETGSFDSSVFYAQQALQYAWPDNKYVMMNAYEWLYKSYEKKKQPDSTYKYFRLTMSTKDSLFTIEKNRSIQSMNFQEQIRQEELATEKTKAEEQRKQNLQYALIALGIITFIIFFLLLSRRHITNTKIIGFLGVVALLLVFEFLNLLLHPFLERIAHHSPALMLLALVFIAALLVPLHHKLEKWATHKLVEKNKQIRLAAAKKTIRLLSDQELEKES